MKRSLLSLLLAMVMVVTSLDMVVLVAKAKENEEIESSEEEETQTDTVDVAANYERISRVSRDDGTWLFPLNKTYWNSFSDWAGCPGYSKCNFCGTVHSSWGDNAHTGQSYGHNGFDIGVPIGTSVLAAASGTVAYTSTGNNGGRGNYIVIEHPINGIGFSYYSYYQHLNSISVVKGASVKAGDTIAKSGNSGIGTGAHLHFGIVMAKKGTNIGNRLYEIESKGWVTGSENKEGRILVNPSTKQQNMPTGNSSVIPPLAYHSGSVTYTFDKSKVIIGLAPCNFSGQITSPAEWAAFNTSNVKITASAIDTYAISSFTIKLWFNGVNEKTETVTAYKSGNVYIGNCDFNLSSQGVYAVDITATCQNGGIHSIGVRYFSYDTTAPIISDLKAYEDHGDFYCSAIVKDNITSNVNSWFVIKDEKGNEKRFECEKNNNNFLGIWSDISGLGIFGRYIITFCAQDDAGNIRYETLHDIIISEVSLGSEKIYMTVGEEREVDIQIDTLFITEGKDGSEKTDEGMKATLKAVEPGWKIFRFSWIGKNNAFSANYNYDIYVYTVPQAPKITQISSRSRDYDIITYEPVTYAQTYELYCKRIGIDADYQFYGEYTDSKSHSIVADHIDKNIVYCYKLRAKAEQTIDGCTGGKFYPTSDFSNDVYSEENGETEESGSIEESSTEESSTEESSIEESDSTEDNSFYGESDITDGTKDDSPYTDSERQDLSSLGASISNIHTKVYSRDEYEPAVKVTAFVNGRKVTLTEGMDYRVSYKDNINAGTATVTIKGNGEYKGSLTKNYTISPKSVKKLKLVTGALPENEQGIDLSEFPIHIYDGTKRLSLGTDYTLSSAGMTTSSAKVTITGKGNYTGATTAKLTIYNTGSDQIINPDNVRLNTDTAVYTGKAVKTVEPVVTVGSVTLAPNKDYKVQYKNNTNAGTAYVIVTGKGAYKGKVVVPFTIGAASVSSGGLIIKPIPAKTYSGKLQKPAVTVTVQNGGSTKKLVKYRDYKVTYKDNLHAGTATAIITGKGNYAGMKEQIQFTINPQKITKAAVKGTQEKLTLTYGRRALKENTHYEPPVYGEIKKNKVKVTIKGKGDFTGEITKYIKQ